jgi:hypothetical protein
MLAILQLLGLFVVNLFRSRRRLEVESLFLRHQFNIALRRAPQFGRLRGSDRALLVWTWLWPSLLGLSRVSLARSCDGIEPGFEPIGPGNLAASQGDPESALSCGNLIRRLSKENPLWGAPRIHGELLKLGFEIHFPGARRQPIWCGFDASATPLSGAG